VYLDGRTSCNVDLESRPDALSGGAGLGVAQLRIQPAIRPETGTTLLARLRTSRNFVPRSKLDAVKIKRLEVEGLFSFGTDEDKLVLDLNEPLTVIVGANGSGKSNVSRVLNLVQTAVRLDVGDQEQRTALNTVLNDHARTAPNDHLPPGVGVAIRHDISN
jgi:hypothetical protein